MKIDLDLSPSSFKSNDHTVFHVRPNDYRCDLLLLASNEDKTREIIIPVDKCILETNVPYFKNMFSNGSNWLESKDSECLVPTIKLQLEKPEALGQFIKAIYDRNLDLNVENCVDIYHIIDYLSVESCLKDVEDYVKQNLTFENTIDLMMLMRGKLENEIEKFYEENKLKDPETFMKRLNNASLEVFLSAIHLIFGHIEFPIILEIMKSWITNNLQTKLEDIIPEIKFIFNSDYLANDFNHKDKFNFYNFCMQHISSESAYAIIGIYDGRKLLQI